ncbi:hypothetical protein C1752_10591 [Acaryochloris thomasi RCC1774]|uniref:Uncharacterized protein n=1 Tax=Acaryochloris thomasi RCC1774 TaxID=1764569 RepID=A0A2W1JJZ8_9CYAN|nr:hypothetical protein [Acaryochloris thomasi]PZD70584.1 hypothetical protein C1752_10591 [Acaryochloris thomasi RCC1774]
MKRSHIGITITAISIFVGAGWAITSMQSKAGSRDELKHDKDCLQVGFENTVLTEESYGGKQYKLVRSRKTDDSGWIIDQYSIVTADNAGCTVSSERFSDKLPTTELQEKIVLAYWRSQASSSKEKVNLEEFLANTPIGITGVSSLGLLQQDLDALDQLGVKYPSYVKAIDSFDSPEKAEEYYLTIFNDQWFKAHPEAGAD